MASLLDMIYSVINFIDVADMSPLFVLNNTLQM